MPVHLNAVNMPTDFHYNFYYRLAQRLKKILSKLINENQIMLKTDLKGLIYDRYRI
jgi:hypothetical protein